MDEPELSAESQADKRRTVGEHAATKRQELTRNDSKRQGREHDRSVTAGQEAALLVFTRQLATASM
jgi:hypothetical protein